MLVADGVRLHVRFAFELEDVQPHNLLRILMAALPWTRCSVEHQGHPVRHRSRPLATHCISLVLALPCQHLHNRAQCCIVCGM